MQKQFEVMWMWNPCIPASQGMPRIATSPLKLGDKPGIDSLSEHAERTQIATILISVFWPLEL